jgi:predicted nucleic acid-binding Zn ribbon protein
LADILPDHDHCRVCDEPVEKGEEFCSELCKNEHAAQQRKERNRNWIFMAAVAIVLIALMVIQLVKV